MPGYSSKKHLNLVRMAVVLFALAGCEQGSSDQGRGEDQGAGQGGGAEVEVEIKITHAWLRLPPSAPPIAGGDIARPAAGYMIISNSGDRADALLAVTAPGTATGPSVGVVRISLHRSWRDGDIARMEALDSVPIPARSRVEFAPGGTHVMAFGLDDKMLPGGAIPLTLHFEYAGDMTVTFRAGQQE